MLLVNDGDIQFEWLDNSTILFNPGQHRDNLSSLLAYYAYMILGMDYDTFSLEGGTPHFCKRKPLWPTPKMPANEDGKLLKASKTVTGWWKSLEPDLSPRAHLPVQLPPEGLDVLFQDIEGGRLTIAEALIDMRSTNRIRPGSYNIQVFFLSKSDEIINIFSPAPDAERGRLLPS